VQFYVVTADGEPRPCGWEKVTSASSAADSQSLGHRYACVRLHACRSYTEQLAALSGATSSNAAHKLAMPSEARGVQPLAPRSPERSPMNVPLPLTTATVTTTATQQMTVSTAATGRTAAPTAVMAVGDMASGVTGRVAGGVTGGMGVNMALATGLAPGAATGPAGRAEPPVATVATSTAASDRPSGLAMAGASEDSRVNEAVLHSHHDTHASEAARKAGGGASQLLLGLAIVAAAVALLAMAYELRTQVHRRHQGELLPTEDTAELGIGSR